jgi:flagellar biosynthesis protein FlhB
VSDDADKSFAATATRRKRALREGNVARSADLGGTIAFGCALLGACASVPLCARSFGLLLADAAREPRAGAPRGLLVSAVAVALTPAIAGACGGVAFALLQGGGLHVGGVSCDLKRLDPVAGCKRLIGGDAFITAARAAAAFVAALCALLPAGRDLLAAGVAVRSPAAAAAVAWTGALRACGALVIVGLLFGAAEYALARRRWLRGLRMSHEELKRDTKENDGDPQARARRKTLHRDLIRGAIARTREASFVVVNPTHVAIALRYAPPAVPVPEILVRALDDGALRVRAIASESGIPIVEDAPLARVLYATSLRTRTIAPETYVAVAQIVAELAQAGLLR